MNTEQAPVARVFNALADPTRRAIVERLARQPPSAPMSVSRLAEPFDMTITAVSQHLAVLEESGLVRTTKTGRVRTCAIEKRGFSVLETWISHQRALWDERLDQLGELLAEPELGPEDDEAGWDER